MNPHHDLAEEAVEHLTRTERGRRTLAILFELHREACLLDDGNTAAMRTLTELSASRQLNGTLLDLLRPHAVVTA